MGIGDLDLTREAKAVRGGASGIGHLVVKARDEQEDWGEDEHYFVSDRR